MCPITTNSHTAKEEKKEREKELTICDCLNTHTVIGRREEELKVFEVTGMGSIIGSKAIFYGEKRGGHVTFVM